MLRQPDDRSRRDGVAGGAAASRWAAVSIRLVLATLLVLIGFGGRPAAADESRPNIVIVLVDDFDATMYEHLPQLRDGGLVFENHIFSTALCCPSRASLLTGLHAWNHEVRDIAWPEGGWGKFRVHEPEALPVHLKRAGYRTGYVGKYMNEYGTAEIPPGWDEWRADIDDTGKYRSREVNENGLVRRDEEYSTDYIGRHGLEFIQSGAGPFFLVLAPNAPHRPATPAARHRNAPFEASGFYREKLRSMLAVVEMLEQVRAAVGPDTYIFFLSDNGFHYGSDSGKNTPYSTDTQVPMVVWGPGVEPGVVEALSAQVDIFSTVLELAGAGLDRDGLSLVPFLRGQVPATWRSYVPLYHPGYEPGVWAIRSQTHLFIEPDRLFRVGRERERDNRFAASRYTAAELALALERLTGCQGAACNEASPGPVADTAGGLTVPAGR